ncbi:hypothetical protein OAG68_01690 [bacterium]|nr:hypothetical protein [bacterium]
MDEDNGWGYQHATENERKAVAAQIVEEVFASVKSLAIAAVDNFLAQSISPTAMMNFELGRENGATHCLMSLRR